MRGFQQHIRDTFLAGVFAGVPIVVTVIIVTWIDEKTQILAQPLLERRIPLLGIVVSIVSIYIIGVIVRSLVGRSILSSVDSLLRRMPIIRPIYEAWKQVSLTPGGKGGMFTQVVLVKVDGEMMMIGFTSGEAAPGNPDVVPVFVPNSPNPITGRLFFIRREQLTVLPLSTEEALKLVIASGNYMPQGLTAGLRKTLSAPQQN